MCLTDTRLQLVLDVPRTDPPGAWTASPDGTRWTLRRADPTGYDPQQRGYVLAPFPALATVGHSTGGEHWLLDLERIGSLTMTGDHRPGAGPGPVPGRRARPQFVGRDAAGDPGRVRRGDGRHAPGPARPTPPTRPRRWTVLAAQRRSVTGVVDQAGVDVLQGRLREGADAWAPHVLLIDPGGDDAAAVSDLVTAVNADTGRSTVALVVTTATTTTRTTDGRAVAGSDRRRRCAGDPGSGPGVDRPADPCRTGRADGAAAGLRRRHRRSRRGQHRRPWCDGCRTGGRTCLGQDGIRAAASGADLPRADGHHGAGPAGPGAGGARAGPGAGRSSGQRPGRRPGRLAGRDQHPGQGRPARPGERHPGAGEPGADVVENHRDRRLPDHPTQRGEHRPVRHRPLAG